MSLDLISAIGPPPILVASKLPPRRRFGVPPSGPFDPESWQIATAVVGTLSAWELALGTFTFQATTECQVGLTGSIASISVDGSPRAAGRVGLHLNQRLQVQVGNGARAYLSQDPVEAEDLPIDQPKRHRRLRIILRDPAIELPALKVSPLSDRVGVRLLGFGQTHEIERPSEPMVPGAIQWTPDGTLIALGPDGPTIGGYPVIGTIASVDLSTLGQLLPNEEISLEPIDLGQARDLLRSERIRIEQRITMIALAASLRK